MSGGVVGIAGLAKQGAAGCPSISKLMHGGFTENNGIKATVVRNLLEGSGIQLTRPNTTKLSGAQLGQRITESTVHLSCLMTMAQIEQVRDQKVLFTEFD